MSLSNKAHERLSKLANVLEELPSYVRGEETDSITTLKVPIDTFNMDEWGCGTTACAAGVAMVHPWFRKRGLTYSGSGVRNPLFKGAGGTTALEGFFDISEEQVEFLFMPDSYPKSHTEAAYVANRIRQLVNRDGEIVSKVFAGTRRAGYF